jgi:hypothetical protein
VQRAGGAQHRGEQVARGVRAGPQPGRLGGQEQDQVLPRRQQGRGAQLVGERGIARVAGPPLGADRQQAGHQRRREQHGGRGEQAAQPAARARLAVRPRQRVEPFPLRGARRGVQELALGRD